MNDNSKKIRRPLLLFVRGIPGSGKTYLTHSLAAALGKKTLTILDPDTLNTTAEDYLSFAKTLEEDGLDPAIYPFRWLRQRACSAVVNEQIVIWSQPFTKQGIFERLVDYIESYAQDRGIRVSTTVVEVSIDPAIAFERIRQRKQAGGHGPSKTTFEQRVTQFTSFSESFDTITVDGTTDTQESVERIINHISSDS